jgi:hypothetical protein
MSGDLLGRSTEAHVQAVARPATTLSNLYVLVIANVLGSATSIGSRIAGAGGNLTVSVGAAATGAFEDDANTDSPTAGQAINTEGVAGSGMGGDSIDITVIRYLSSDDSIWMKQAAAGGENIGASSSFFQAVAGELRSPASEASTQYRFREAPGEQLSDLFGFVSTNNLTGSSTFESRINGADGNLSVSVAAAATGFFEDNSNTDDIAAGDLLAYQITSGAPPAHGSADFIVEVLGCHYNSRAATVLIGSGRGSVLINNSLTVFQTIGGDAEAATATENDVELEPGINTDARNVMLSVASNTLNGATTVRLRLNNADTTIVVSIGATAGGDFEDTTNTASVGVDDTINWEIDTTASTFGLFNMSVLGIELEPQEQSFTPEPVGIQQRTVMRAY